MSGFNDTFYHPQYYSLEASDRDPDDSQHVQGSNGDPAVAPSLMGYSQSGAYDFGQYQNIYNQSQEPSVFRDGTPNANIPSNITTHPANANQLQTSHHQHHHHHGGYTMQGSSLEGRLSNVNISYDPWSSAEVPMFMDSHANSDFSYGLSNAYPMPSQLASQHMSLNSHSAYPTLQTHTQTQSTYWNVDDYRVTPQHEHPVAQGQVQSSQSYSQSYTSQRTLQPRAIQPKRQPSFQGGFILLLLTYLDPGPD